MAKIVRGGTMVCLLVFLLVVSQEVQVGQATIDCNNCSKGSWVDWWVCRFACQCSLGYCASASQLKKDPAAEKKLLMKRQNLKP